MPQKITIWLVSIQLIEIWKISTQPMVNPTQGQFRSVTISTYNYSFLSYPPPTPHIRVFHQI